MDEDKVKEIKELTEGFNKAAASLDDIRTRLGDAEEKVGHVPGDLKEVEDRITADLAENFVARQDAVLRDERMDELEKRIEKYKSVQTEDEKVQDSIFHKAVYARLATFAEDAKVAQAAREDYKKYASEIEDVETRTMMEAVDTSGGIFLDPDTQNEILRNVMDIDPVRSVAGVASIQKKVYEAYRETGTPTGYWDTEIGSGSDSEPSYSNLEIPVHGVNVKVPISSDLLSDVRFMESEIGYQAGRKFDYTEGVAFVEGDGVGRPMGFTVNVGTNDNIYPASVTGSGTQVIAADDIPEMWGTLKARYRANAHWVFNSNTFISLLKLQDENDRYYLLSDGGLRASPGVMLYGLPFVVCESLADEGDEAYPLWIGDFKEGYKIVDRTGIELLRDVFTSYPKVNFKFRKRVGGQVVVAEAIKGLKTT